MNKLLLLLLTSLFIQIHSITAQIDPFEAFKKTSKKETRIERYLWNLIDLDTVFIETEFDNACRSLKTTKTSASMGYNSASPLQKDTFIYRINGLPFIHLTYSWDFQKKVWKDSLRHAFSYVLNGTTLKSVTHYGYDSFTRQWQPTSVDNYGYNSLNLLQTYTSQYISGDLFFNSQRIFYEYTDLGLVKKTKNETWDRENLRWQTFSTDEASFNALQKIKDNYHVFYLKNTIWSAYKDTFIYVYNDQNFLLKQTNLHKYDTAQSWTNSSMIAYQQVNAKGKPKRIAKFRWFNFRDAPYWAQSNSTEYIYQNDTIIKSAEFVHTDPIADPLIIWSKSAFDYCGISTAISDITQSSNSFFNISPNPAFQNINIHFDENINEQVSYEMYNLAGQVSKKGIINPIENIKLDISNCDSGLYFLKIKAKDKISVQKIVVLRP